MQNNKTNLDFKLSILNCRRLKGLISQCKKMKHKDLLNTPFCYNRTCILKGDSDT